MEVPFSAPSTSAVPIISSRSTQRIGTLPPFLRNPSTVRVVKCTSKLRTAHEDGNGWHSPDDSWSPSQWVQAQDEDDNLNPVLEAVRTATPMDSEDLCIASSVTQLFHGLLKSLHLSKEGVQEDHHQ